MRTEDAIYGGEMSAHHYFRDFAYCDSGMIPWLLVHGLVCLKGQSLVNWSGATDGGVSGERGNNSRLAMAAAIARVGRHFAEEAQAVDRTARPQHVVPDWRFNLRSSNTEPVVRLNVESRGDIPPMEARTRTAAEIGVTQQISRLRVRWPITGTTMTNLKARTSQNHASLISMVQRFQISPSCLAGCGSSVKSVDCHSCTCTRWWRWITLVVFQMLGG